MITEQLHLKGGTLTMSLIWSPGWSLIMGFEPAAARPASETYGGCDAAGLAELAWAISAGRDAFVHDHSSGPMHARLIWDEQGQRLNLRAAGEDVVLTLSEAERANLLAFLQRCVSVCCDHQEH